MKNEHKSSIKQIGRILVLPIMIIKSKSNKRVRVFIEDWGNFGNFIITEKNNSGSDYCVNS